MSKFVYSEADEAPQFKPVENVAILSQEPV